jgi:hypothetical protein
VVAQGRSVVVVGAHSAAAEDGNDLVDEVINAVVEVVDDDG